MSTRCPKYTVHIHDYFSAILCTYVRYSALSKKVDFGRKSTQVGRGRSRSVEVGQVEKNRPTPNTSFNHIGNLNHITDVVIHCKADIVNYVLFANYQSMETKSFI